MTIEKLEGICVAYQNLIIACILKSLYLWENDPGHGSLICLLESVNREGSLSRTQLDGTNGRRLVNKTNTFQLFDIRGCRECDFFFLRPFNYIP